MRRISSFVKSAKKSTTWYLSSVSELISGKGESDKKTHAKLVVYSGLESSASMLLKRLIFDTLYSIYNKQDVKLVGYTVPKNLIIPGLFALALSQFGIKRAKDSLILEYSRKQNNKSVKSIIKNYLISQGITDRQQQGEIFKLATSDVNQTCDKYMAIVPSIFDVLFCLYDICVKGWPNTLGFMGSVLLRSWYSQHSEKQRTMHIQRINKAINNAQNNFTAINDNTRNFIKNSGMLEFEKDRIAESALEVVKNTVLLNNNGSKSSSINGVVNLMVQMAAVIGVVHFSVDDKSDEYVFDDTKVDPNLWIKNFIMQVFDICNTNNLLFDSSLKLEKYQSAKKTTKKLLDALEANRGKKICKGNKNPFNKKIGQIQFKDVNFSYPKGKKKALQSLTSTIQGGKITIVHGNNGVGKSTVLSLLSGLIEPSSGSIKINGEKLSEIKESIFCENIAHCPPDFYKIDIDKSPLYWVLYSKKNLSWIGKLGGDSLSNDEKNKIKHANKLLKSLGLSDDQINKPVQKLSDGYKQRVIIAVTLSKGASICLFDEPTSAIASGAVPNIMDIIRRETRDSACIIVTHDKEIIKKSRRRGDNVLNLFHENGKAFLEENTESNCSDDESSSFSGCSSSLNDSKLNSRGSSLKNKSGSSKSKLDDSSRENSSQLSEKDSSRKQCRSKLNSQDSKNNSISTSGEISKKKSSPTKQSENSNSNSFSKKSETKIKSLLLQIAKHEKVKSASHWHELGSAYYYGTNGKEKDDYFARLCYEESIKKAKNESDKSNHYYTEGWTHYNLGFFYSRGRGCDKSKENKEEGRKMFEKARKRGHKGAINELNNKYSK